MKKSQKQRFYTVMALVLAILMMAGAVTGIIYALV